MGKNTLQIASRVVFPVVAIIFSVVYLRQISDIPPQDALLVRPVAIILIIISAIALVVACRNSMKLKPDTAGQSARPKQNRNVLFFIAACVVYLGILTTVGFLISTALYIYVMSWILGVRKKKTLIGVSLATPLSLYMIFQVLLGVPLPVGLLQHLF